MGEALGGYREKSRATYIHRYSFKPRTYNDPPPPPPPSSETQGQIVGVRKSLNGWENMTRRKVKNGEKSRRSGFWLGRKTQKFSGTNQKPGRRRPFGTGLVRHCPQGLYSPFFTFLLRAIFFRPFILSLAPTICPWVSEDAPPLHPTRFLWIFSPRRSNISTWRF